MIRIMVKEAWKWFFQASGDSSAPSSKRGSSESILTLN